MFCNLSRARQLWIVGALALSLGACAKQQPAVLPPPPASSPSLPVPGSDAAPAPAAAPSATYRVRSASPSVLERYPRGSVVTRDSIICLTQGEQITISGSNGQQVSYRGPGCMQRTGRPSYDNEGGFIFGRSGYGVDAEVAVLP